MSPDAWSSGDLYEPFIGRWSRLLAADVVSWLDPPPGLRWLDVGCGTGAATVAVLGGAAPLSVLGVDPSEAFVAQAAARVGDGRASFRVGTADSLPVPDSSVDLVVSGLVLNFVPDASAALREMQRALAPGGSVAAYVWDYADGMRMLRLFWDAAVAVDPGAAAVDEGVRFPICRPGALEQTFVDAGLGDVRGAALEVATVFRDFDDYWTPFLGGQGPAPSYCATLSSSTRERLRARLAETVPVEPDGSIRLTARAWAARGSATLAPRASTWPRAT